MEAVIILQNLFYVSPEEGSIDILSSKGWKSKQ